MEKEIALTGKQKLVYEACLKIEQGQRLMAEGRLELSNLIPDGSYPLSVGEMQQRFLATKNKVVRGMHRSSMVRRVMRTDEELMDKILDLIDENENVTAHFIHEKLKIHTSRIERLRQKLVGKVVTVPHGQRKYWVRVRLKAAV